MLLNFFCLLTYKISLKAYEFLDKLQGLNQSILILEALTEVDEVFVVVVVVVMAAVTHVYMCGVQFIRLHYISFSLIFISVFELFKIRLDRPIFSFLSTSSGHPVST